MDAAAEATAADPAPSPPPSGQASSATAARLVENVGRVIAGKEDVLQVTVATMLSRGHALLEDVPGVGKTTLAKSLAKSVACDFGRVQATSDLLPSDVVGITVLAAEGGDFVFHRGPIFTNVLLMDEINRATPRTQSCLLEAMAERQVTVDRQTYPLEDPFFVIATQNPAEQVGTYYLPESQMDRFAVRIEMGYPSPESEAEVLRARDRGHDPLADLEPVCSAADLVEMQRQAREVKVADAVQQYLLALVAGTRDRKGVLTGVSTRGALTFQSLCQAFAYLAGRDHVTPDDVKHLAVPCLAHRLLLGSRLRSSRDDQEDVIRNLLDEVPCP